MSSSQGGYTVLARKYRPHFFADLIGQEAMVRTLANAFNMGRLAHAFLLTGVRGVGKTTTARLIARALNCSAGPQGAETETFEPCDGCADCKAISLGNHPDVLEMDAASRTGVDDIRELIDGVRYGPVQGKYKVYVIDEVHMLSVNAFNALLKTLEEPPPHVKFIFATTEVRKIPVTVISRCQRFDLRRVSADALIEQFEKILKMESVAADSTALSLIARAADGSVRDGLSILDQAIGYAGDEPVGTELVRNMIGLADRARVFDLFEQVMQGEVGDAFSTLRSQYGAGADPLVVLEDLLRVVHWLTNLKLETNTEAVEELPEVEFERGKAVAAKLSVSDLTKAWQILLKGHGEVQYSSAPLEATEMVLVRLAHAADLPNPAELVTRIEGAGDTHGGQKLRATVDPAEGDMADTDRRVLTETVTSESGVVKQCPDSFDGVVKLFSDRGEMRLYACLQDRVRLVSFSVGHIVIQVGEDALPKLAMLVGRHLREWTGRKWVVELADIGGGKTLMEQKLDKEERDKREATKDPRVQALLDNFPESEVTAVRDISEKNGSIGEEAQ
ncbi:MAG: DNA polymerase III subunit gamma/tau [Rhodospirillaceae bacterium]|nr:DNA polymerase III subunit gamma/tau [Rhodospirillaceae bacterium]